MNDVQVYVATVDMEMEAVIPQKRTARNSADTTGTTNTSTNYVI